MRRVYLLVAVLLIIGATYAIEYYANTQYPTEELVVTSVSGLELGTQQRYNYYKDMEFVGTYVYSVERLSDSYVMESETDVTYEGQSLELASLYTFDSSYSPETYSLTVTSNSDVTEIQTSLSDGEIITSVTVDDLTVDLTEDFVHGMFLIENNMPGFWEVLFNSAELERGVRYTASVYIPQGAAVFEMNLVVNKQDQEIRIDNERYTCMVIKEADLELGFYLFEGELVQMRGDEQDILLQKIIN